MWDSLVLLCQSMPTFSYDPVALELPKALEKPTRIFKGDVSCLEMLGETMKVLRKLLIK